ncbi:hypothetical protein GCM10010211_10580 [Streptomyces albospinus]|uniref:Uncharacterized protein n=1 Tax=Streptomyces albospinus TaxID=285515 RepID=A0ABQ2USS5_9ACTN|nr:hypothetical protein [Streptomyces albospinus]GGU48256.1 hypothetical protein GCM10010211_10580 [Streptomyces albospinus]
MTHQTTKAAQQTRQAHVAGATAAATLAAALARLDIVLPSLHGSWPVGNRGFVELGGCSASLASRLAQRINAAADALQAAQQEGQ